MRVRDLEQLLASGLPQADITIETQDEQHFHVTIVSAVFNGVSSKVQRQQMIYKILHDYITSGEIHAIAMKLIAQTEHDNCHKPL